MAVSAYKVFVTPLHTNATYGAAVEITDYVISSNFSKIKKSIDAGNYDIGVYTYADLSMTVVNYEGLFNNDTDSESMFYFTRDRAKVQIKYIDEATGTNVVYDGLINDEATLQDLEKDTVKFRILSLDSIFRKVKVLGGLINDNDTVSAALKSLLNRPAITAVIPYNAAKVTVGYDAIINDATPFSQKDSRNVLELLLNASGSVFYIDSVGEMTVKDRSVLTKTAVSLFGPGDEFQRDNIIKVKNYNDGLQRTFNTITVNETTSTDETFVDRYGVNIKSHSFDFITATTTYTGIADYYLGQFKQPKVEMVVYVKTDLAKTINILDPIIVDYKKLHKMYDNNRIPFAGTAIAGTDVAPYIIGGLEITPNITWKVIGVEHNTKAFITALRLRQS